ncbi:MAG: SDR family NAD(P)-dependent oxidoreductase [Burkholderiales bacterium]|nr:SDR family NAD(P)-dependent oxidoreductase [Burkholderiales bacterium]
MELKGKVALVTGGNGGLGSRICHALARAGCDVAVIYARSREPAEVVAGELRQLGVQSEAIGCDVTDPAAVQTLMGEVARRFGRIDILINDAAYNKWIPYPDLDALTFEEWQKILSTNLTGPMLCIKAVAPIMRSQESGRIVNISSVAGLAPTGSSIAYAVSKAGLIHLTKCMAVALAPHVLVNCIAPGYIEGTRATSNLDPAYQQRSRESSLLKRAADKDDIAAQVVELCRTDSITGQTLAIDAGRVFH